MMVNVDGIFRCLICFSEYSSRGNEKRHIRQKHAPEIHQRLYHAPENQADPMDIPILSKYSKILLMQLYPFIKSCKWSGKIQVITMTNMLAC